MKSRILDIMRSGMDALDATLKDRGLVAAIEGASAAMTEAFRRGRKVLVCGNGGSAAQAQHMAAELSGRFYIEREPLDAEALHVNSSYLTAVANDYSYDEVFARLLRAKGCPGDILVAISTSGTSKNIIEALKVARDKGMKTVGLCGGQANGMATLCDYLLCVPCMDTPRVQEVHMIISHAICEIVEDRLFGAPSAQTRTSVENL